MILRYLVVLAAIAQVPAAYLLSAGQFESGIANAPVVYIQPAGWTFGIWGLIYLLSITFAVYQVIPKNDNQLLRAVRIPALIAFVGSSLWLVAANSTGAYIWLTIPILFSIAIALCVVVVQPPLANPKAQWFSYSTLMPYAAWTGIAQWLNIQALVNAEGLITTGAMNTTSNVFLLIIIAFFSLYWLRKAQYSLWYGGVIIWASMGVIAANTGSPEGSVIIATMAGALGLAAMALVRGGAREQHVAQ